jgi:Leucine-rich repeat (LRR) protein
LTRLPDAIGCLTRLQKLNFADNKLTDVPLSLGNIYGMQVYDSRVTCACYVAALTNEGVKVCRGEGNKIHDEELMYAMQFDADHVVDYCQKRVLKIPGIDPDDFIKQVHANRYLHRGCLES